MMWGLVVTALWCAGSCEALIPAISIDPATQTLPRFKVHSHGHIGLLTTSAGRPVEYHEGTSSLNSDLLRHTFFMESMTHLSRERIPERLVHARGAGAFGFFQVTHDVSHLCRAKFLSEVGKKTPIAVRFSEVGGERGATDTRRDIRGFAVKLYTEEGNFDLIGLNTPAFAMKDPVFFPPFTHAIKPSPVNNVMDVNMQWDIFSQRPESAIFMLTLFSDAGTPDGYRHMPGFSIHTYEVVNKHEEPHFIRFHIIPDAGIRNLNANDATTIGGQDQDYATRDLYNAIAKGNYPSWTVAIQVLTLDEVKKAKHDPFDVTKVLPLDLFPLLNIGRIVLNKNPINYFAEIEQLAFNPGQLVPGILGAPDKLFEARLLSYRDAQYYRLGANFNKITVNCPLSELFTYNRDGRAPVKDNERDSPNYFPNSFNGPVPYLDKKSKTKLLDIVQDDSDDIGNVRLYFNAFSQQQRNNLVTNLVSGLSNVTAIIQARAIKLFHTINPLLAKRVALGLKVNSTVSQDSLVNQLSSLFSGTFFSN